MMRTLSLAVMMFATLPVFAQNPEACVAPAAQIAQIAAGKADGKDVAKALNLSKTAKLLCEHGNTYEAQKKFRKAFTLLGAEMPTAVAQR
jgi:hypothetical protein